MNYSGIETKIKRLAMQNMRAENASKKEVQKERIKNFFKRAAILTAGIIVLAGSPQMKAQTNQNPSQDKYEVLPFKPRIKQDLSKAKIVGPKLFDVELIRREDYDTLKLIGINAKNGKTYLISTRPEYEVKSFASIWMREPIRQIHQYKAGDVYYTYFITDRSAIGIRIEDMSLNYDDSLGIKLGGMTAPDSGKIFFDAVHITPKGYLVAVTPGGVIILTDGNFHSFTFDWLVDGEAPKLVNPQVRDGPNGTVEIWDPVMEDVKVVISDIEKPRFRVVIRDK